MILDQFAGHFLIKGTETTAEGDWIVHGPLASSKEDYDKEILTKSGVMKGLQAYVNLNAPVDFEHMWPKTKSLQWIIGKGIGIVDEGGDKMPTLVVRLQKNKTHAKELWEHLHSDPPGDAGFSIYGLAKSKDGKRVTDTEIQMVTIALQPKGFDLKINKGMHLYNNMMALAKARARERNARSASGRSYSIAAPLRSRVAGGA